jgi:hypothetical protein
MRPQFRPSLDFTPSPTLCDFIHYWPDNPIERAVLGVFGPVGSGKSTAMCAKVMQIAMAQDPDPEDNIRKARIAIIRATTPQLKSTTIKTWLDIFPAENCGPIVYSSPITHTIQARARDGLPGLYVEIIFLALDNVKDIGKLKSMDLTAAYVNEADGIHSSVFRYIRRRLGRYPRRKGSYQAKFPILIMDCNAVDEDDPLAEYYYNPPESWRFWMQPPAVLEVKQVDGNIFEVVEDDPRYKGVRLQGRSYEGANRTWMLNPDAENLEHLVEGYYQTQVAGSKLSEIQRDLQVKFVFNSAGKPVIPDYADDFHAREFAVLADVEIEIGSDVGGGTLNPAGVIFQRHPRGVILVHDELAAANVGVKRFSLELDRALQRPHFQGIMRPESGVQLHTDPAGSKGDELFNVAVHDHLTGYGWRVRPAWTNDPAMRIEAITNAATRLVSAGMPGLLIHKRCKLLRKSLAGKWQYKRLKISGNEDRYHEKPDKTHPWSDLGDGLGYGCMGAGEARRFQRPQKQRAVVNFDPYAPPPGPGRAKTNFDPFGA